MRVKGAVTDMEYFVRGQSSRIFVYKKKNCLILQVIFRLAYTVRKVSVFGVVLVRIFPHLDGIRRDTQYPSVFSLNAGKC